MVLDCAELLSKVEEFRREAKYSDIRICVEDRTFECHRLILAAASSYFDAMFAANNFRESYSKEFYLHDVNAEVFEEILECTYTGRDPTIIDGNIYSLLYTSEFLKMQLIQKFCVEYILKNMYSIQNVIEIFTFARATNIITLINPLAEFICGNLSSLSQDNAFLTMQFDDLFAVLTKLTTISPILRNENYLLDALVRWLRSSYGERNNHFKKLVEMICLAEISEEFIEYSFREYKLKLSSSLQIENSLGYESMSKTLLLSNNSFIDNQHAPVLPASYMDYESSKKALSLHLYIRNTPSSDTAANIISVNKYKPDGFVSTTHSSASIQSIISDEMKYLYCLQKRNEVGPQSFYTYSSVDLSIWNARKLHSPPVESRLTGAIEKQSNRIYFHTRCESPVQQYHEDAFTDEEIERSLYYYNIELNKWFPTCKLGDRKTRGPSMTTHNGLVYMIGGRALNNYHYMQAYDHRSPKWFALPAINSGVLNSPSCALNGKLYVESMDGTLEVFDTVAGKWEPSDCKFVQQSIRYIVPYENMLWLIFSLYTFTIKVYKPELKQLFKPPPVLLKESIISKCCPKPNSQKYIFNAVVF